MHPHARKLRPPKGRSWASRCSEYAIDGEPNRWRYAAYDVGWTIKDGPGQGPNGERRIFAVVGARPATHPRGHSDGAIALFEELATRPLNDRSSVPVSAR